MGLESNSLPKADIRAHIQPPFFVSPAGGPLYFWSQSGTLLQQWHLESSSEGLLWRLYKSLAIRGLLRVPQSGFPLRSLETSRILCQHPLGEPGNAFRGPSGASFLVHDD